MTNHIMNLSQVASDKVVNMYIFTNMLANGRNGRNGV